MSNCAHPNLAHAIGDAPDQKGQTLYLTDEQCQRYCDTPLLQQSRVSLVFSPDQP